MVYTFREQFELSQRCLIKTENVLASAVQVISGPISLPIIM